MEIEFLYFYLAVLTYILFISVSVLVRVGRSQSPMASFNSLHLKFSIVYLILSVIVSFYKGHFDEILLIKILIGYITFFLVHYSIFLNFFALAQRSISSAILKLLYQNQNLSINDLDKIYASGKGFVHIQNSRLSDLQNLGWVVSEKENVKISSKGVLVLNFVNFILKLWGLKQIGVK
ncbi:hypothetical protein JWG41_01215 [Leptospira sp. 201903075]|uniref:hypothetical protein n=1 Tax=Leptospira chreensis TaxID=2810035 RepID=UPI00196256E6|nr:hypothetical protein [Leptospira chreensis]MBM9589048.1 hypothetical protein [Leptospira chreensis]